MKKWLLIAAFLCFGYTYQDIKLEPTKYSDVISASIAGLREADAAPLARQYEYGGVVVELPGHLYQITEPLTNHRVDLIIFPTIDKWKGLPVVGFWHTHVCDPRYAQWVFSPEDIAQANGLHKYSTMLDECSGNVYFYDPKNDNQPPDKPWRGHIVGYIPVTKKAPLWGLSFNWRVI